MLLDALSALELLNKEGGTYAATSFAAQYLSRTSPHYLGHIIMHHHHLRAGWGPVGARGIGQAAAPPSPRPGNHAPPPPPPRAVAAASRFARDPAEYRGVQLTLIPGGEATR